MWASHQTREPIGMGARQTAHVAGNVSTISPLTDGLAGGAFDGRYLYLAPNANRVTLRFDAKAPPAMPKTWAGSFY